MTIASGRVRTGLLVAGAALAGLLGGVMAPPARRATAADKAAASKPARAGKPACRRATECVLVPDDCCPCSGGGKQRAIPAKERDAYERARKERCSETMCASVMSTDPSCAATQAVCKEGVCALGGPTPPAAAD